MRRGRLKLGVIAAASAIGLCSLGISALALPEQAFPHEQHQGLFPLCTGCHVGIPVGDEDVYYPEPASCDGCHDGVLEARVPWQGPSGRLDNIRFEHLGHGQDLVRAGDPPLQCASCHVPAGGGRMAVADSIQVGTCLSCHAHEAAEHQVDANCAACHLPLAETRFDRARIEALPRPPDHEASTFLDAGHHQFVQENGARCATCHTRELCTACHVDVEREAVRSFPAAPPGMDLPVTAARYSTPTSHGEGDWLATHGIDASRQGCATCHTSDDCTTCHVEPAPPVIRTIPARADVVAPGVELTASAPDSHDSFFFLEAHATLAAADDVSCATCHQESFCVGCHDGPVGGGYHPPDFLPRHSADAFGRDSDCSNCHNTQVFCRQCHVQVGLAATGRSGPGYHADGPLWLLRHGQAARQNLEGCASCHRQVDCTQCHGALGAFRVSPHSASFDAERAWARSPRTCLGCHIGNPLGGDL